MSPVMQPQYLTNPLEGAALGMSLLESLAESGPLLTIATTHHGELKTLKYSNEAFENACMEFDEVNLKPTYRILWGVPGSSNAIKIAERLGLPNVILGNARELYGAGSAEINEVILEMERLKQNLGKHVNEAQNYLNVTQCKFKVGEFQRTRMRATRTYLRRRIKRWRKRMARYASSGQENKKATLDT